MKHLLFKAARRRHFTSSRLTSFQRACSSNTEQHIEGVLPATFLTPESFGIQVYPNFLNTDEEESLISAADASLSRRIWEEGHWDAVIKNYRETQVLVSRLAPLARTATTRAAANFPAGPLTGLPQASVHFLELSPSGEILPHVDSIKFSGGIVAGLCLLSDAVMLLTPDPPPQENEGTIPPMIKILLPRLSLYTLSGTARYKWAHAIPSGTILFKGKPIVRERRISVMLRDELVIFPPT
jgi:alkylated DNA repair protein alkB family protein 7